MSWNRDGRVRGLVLFDDGSVGGVAGFAGIAPDERTVPGFGFDMKAVILRKLIDVVDYSAALVKDHDVRARSRGH